MIGIRKGIAWERIREKNIGAGYREMKAIDIKIKGKVKDCNIICIHRKPGKKIPMYVWRNVVKDVNNKEHWIIAGDFNAHNIIWNCKNTNVNGSRLYEAMEEKGMYIVNAT